MKASQNQIHAANNLLITLVGSSPLCDAALLMSVQGFSNPTKTDRRFFQSRIRELIQQGVVEKVIVPSNRKNSNGSTVKCFRLVSDSTGAAIQDDGAAVFVQADDGKDDDFVGRYFVFIMCPLPHFS